MAATEKDIKKLGRTELLELLIQQTEENERLRARLNDAEDQLSQRRIIMENCGSIAEASLQLSGVFNAAQAAAQEYLESIKLHSETREEIFNRIEAEARAEADLIISDAKRRCRIMEEDAERKCGEMTRYAKKASEDYWNSVSAKLNSAQQAQKADEVNDEEK